MKNIFYYSKKKTFKRFIVSFLIFVSTLRLLILFFSSRPSGRVGSIIIVVFVCGFTLLYSFVMLLILIRKKTIELELSSSGIKYYNSDYKGVGEVKWVDVETVKIEEVEKRSYIAIRVKDNSRYLRSELPGKTRLLLEKNSIALLLNAKNIDLNFSELNNLVNEYFNKYSNTRG